MPPSRSIGGEPIAQCARRWWAVLPFREAMLLVPIIGLIDSQRARALTEQLLSAVRDNRSRVVVIDVHRRTGRGLESLAITWCRQ
jgi:hypothetical protein